MPKNGWKAITVRDEVHDRWAAYCTHYNKSIEKMLEDKLDERKQLQKFAKKITKVPDTVRVYRD